MLDISDPIDARIPWVRALSDLDEAWQTLGEGPRLRHVRRKAEALGAAFEEGPQVGAIRTLPLTTLPYPTRFAFHGALGLSSPYVSLSHRALLIQVNTSEGIKNVLWNPSDVDASKATPFFADLAKKLPAAMQPLFAKRLGSVLNGLSALGLSGEDIDLIAFDHFHTQDVRALLGGRRAAEALRPWFPNALLLAPEREWLDWDDLHPVQTAWFVEDGKRGVPGDRVVLTRGDLLIGEGCILLRTPGHTSGNQTLFMNTEEGVFGCSENGVSCDSWTPYESNISALAAYARRYRRDVVPNANTPEQLASQYTSMVLERSVASRSQRFGGFAQMFPSSELTPSSISPGLRATATLGELRFGDVQVR